MTARAGHSATLHLLAWLSPAFPVGAFAYSHGLEAAVEAGDIQNAATLEAWIEDLIGHGSIRNDAILASAAYEAAQGGASEALRAVNELALAMSTARERRLETLAMGMAFSGAIRAAWAAATRCFDPGIDLAYPVAFGSACAALDLPRPLCLEAFVLAFVQNLLSAALRLGAIGQTDGQRITAGLLPRVEALAAEAGASGLDDIGGCAFRSDVAAMRHETLYSRLFRS